MAEAIPFLDPRTPERYEVLGRSGHTIRLRVKSESGSHRRDRKYSISKEEFAKFEAFAKELAGSEDVIYDATDWKAHREKKKQAELVFDGVPDGLDITPSALDLANENGIDLALLIGIGTGSGGRVTKSDVEDYIASQA